MCACRAASILVFRILKLLPRTVTDAVPAIVADCWVFALTRLGSADFDRIEGFILALGAFGSQGLEPT